MSFMRYIDSQIKKFNKCVLPPICVLCGWRAKKYNLCTACLQNLPIIPDSCYQCGFFMKGANQNTRCGMCINKPPPFDATFSLFPYEQPIVDMVVGLKFRKDLSYARVFGELFCAAIQKWYQPRLLPHLIIPVPLHKTRLKERGFNQSLEIARFISRTIGIGIDIKNVVRVKATKAQSGLNAQERQRNLANAFQTHSHFKGKSVIILDDVITTSSTVLALSKVIKENGADLIHIWSCARRG